MEDKALIINVFRKSVGGRGRREKGREKRKREREKGMVGGEDWGGREQKGTWNEVRAVSREEPRARGRRKGQWFTHLDPQCLQDWYTADARFPSLLSKQ